MQKNFNLFMEEALVEARRACNQGEVPVGAILVYQGEIIARAHNQVEELQDATAHAEILCLRLGAKKLGNWRLLDTILYCTLEPCAMCAGAMLLSRIKKLVWAAPDLRQGADGSFVSFLSANHPIHQMEVETGPYREEAAALMRQFFKEQRNGNTL